MSSLKRNINDNEIALSKVEKNTKSAGLSWK